MERSFWWGLRTLCCFSEARIKAFCGERNRERQVMAVLLPLVGVLTLVVGWRWSLWSGVFGGVSATPRCCSLSRIEVSVGIRGVRSCPSSSCAMDGHRVICVCAHLSVG